MLKLSISCSTESKVLVFYHKNVKRLMRKCYITFRMSDLRFFHVSPWHFEKPYVYILPCVCHAIFLARAAYVVSTLAVVFFFFLFSFVPIETSSKRRLIPRVHAPYTRDRATSFPPDPV